MARRCGRAAALNPDVAEHVDRERSGLGGLFPDLGHPGLVLLRGRRSAEIQGRPSQFEVVPRGHHIRDHPDRRLARRARIAPGLTALQPRHALPVLVEFHHAQGAQHIDSGRARGSRIGLILPCVALGDRQPTVEGVGAAGYVRLHLLAGFGGQGQCRAGVADDLLVQLVEARIGALDDEGWQRPQGRRTGVGDDRSEIFGDIPDGRREAQGRIEPLAVEPEPQVAASADRDAGDAPVKSRHYRIGPADAVVPAAVATGRRCRVRIRHGKHDEQAGQCPSGQGIVTGEELHGRPHGNGLKSVYPRNIPRTSQQA